jgi:hypothetical protein
MANEIVETKAIEQVSESLYNPMMSHKTKKKANKG